MLSAIWIALAVIFIGGERAARVALALSRKLPYPFRRGPTRLALVTRACSGMPDGDSRRVESVRVISRTKH